MTNNWHNHAITSQVISLVVFLWKLIIIRQPHQPRGFSSRNKSRFNFITIHYQDQLTAGPSSRSAQATCHIIKSNFSSLHFVSVRIAPSAFINRSEEHTSELQSRPHLVCRLLLEKKNK